MKVPLQKKLTALILVLSFCFSANAQNIVSLRGKVTTSDGKPAESVTLSIPDLNRKVSTNAKGEFNFTKLPVGSYTVVTNSVGLQRQEQNVTLVAGQNNSLNFVLTETSGKLDEVNISSAKANNFANKKSPYIARMPLENLENPQVYSIVSKELMKEQVTTDIKSALLNTPGAVTYNFPAGGVGIVFRGFLLSPNARNGMETTASRSSLDVSNIERIEVLKGPSGTLFGASVSSFGGVVNLVTKKPFDTTGVELSYTGGSYNLNRLTADVNAPLNKDKTVLFRINAAVHREASFLNYGFNNTTAVAPSLTYKASDKLTFNFDAEIFNANNTRRTYNTYESTTGIPATGVTNPADIQLDYRTSMFHDDNDGKTTAAKVFAQAEYEISDNWKSTTLYSLVSEDVNYSYQSYAVWSSPTQVTRRVGLWGPISNNFTNIQENINGQFSTGSIKHKFLAGLNYRFYDGGRRSGGNLLTLDNIDVTQPILPIRRKAVDAGLVLYTSPVAKQETISAYVSDVVNFTDRLSAMLSLRVDKFERRKLGTAEGFKQTALAPKLGLVYQVIKDQVSFFGNYMNGFQNNNPVNQPDGSLFVPDPTYAVQYEGGVKAELFNKKLSATASYYTINVDKAIRTESGVTFQDGTLKSKGVDLELIGNPIAGLTIVAGYAYNDNRIVKAAPVTVPGGTLDINGNKAAAAPENVANFWATYTLQNNLKGFGFGLGANYVDDNFFTTKNTFYIPSYTVYNATVFYDQSKWRLGLKLNNLTNKKYWDIGGNSQAPRNAMASLSFKF